MVTHQAVQRRQWSSDTGGRLQISKGKVLIRGQRGISPSVSATDVLSNTEVVFSKYHISTNWLSLLLKGIKYSVAHGFEKTRQKVSGNVCLQQHLIKGQVTDSSS